MKAERKPDSVTGNLQDRPLVSIVMSFHNGRDTLPRALRSLLWQTYENWELILLNDGSTDSSDQVVRAFQDSRIRFYDDSVCRGLPARLNQGVALARGGYIARMDADDIAFPERFEKQVDYLITHPEVDLLATTALLVDDKEQAIGVMPVAETHDEICQYPWRGFPMPHPTWMGRADWFRQHSYDERASKAQDQVLLFRAYSESRFASLPVALLGYRYGSISLKKSFLGRWHYMRSALRSREKNLAVKVVIYHAVAAVRDALGLLLGMGSAVRGARLKVASPELVKEWHNIQKRIDDK